MTTSYNRDIATSDTAAELTDGYHLVVEALKLNDIRTIYGVVGIPITDVARIAQASGMRYIGFRHESDAGHAAAAAGFMTKKPGICLTVSAPGFLNGLVALANATTNYFPMAQISGSSERHIVDLKRGDYEELDQLAVAEPFAKAAYRVGNRSRGHVQGVYPTAADDAWVALFAQSTPTGRTLSRQWGDPTCSAIRDSRRQNNGASRMTSSTRWLPTGL